MKKIITIGCWLFSVMIANAQMPAKNHHRTIIEGYFDDDRIDTVSVIFYEQRIAGTPAGSIILKTVTQKGHFIFVLPIKGSISYVCMKSNQAPMLMYDYPLRNGDSNYVYIKTTGNSKGSIPMLLFSGRNCGSFKTKYNIDSAFRVAKMNARHTLFSMDSLNMNIHYLLRTTTASADYAKELLWPEIEKCKNETDSAMLDILQTDYLYQIESIRLSNLLAYRGLSFRHQDSTQRLATIKDFYNTHIKNIPQKIQTKPGSKLVSRYFMEYACLNAMAFLKLNQNVKELNSAQPFISLIEQFDPALREKFTTCLIADLGTYNDIKDRDSLILYGINHIKNSFLSSIIKDYYERSITGREAYSFTLEDTNNHLVSLADFRGKILLIDFWFTGCFGCTQVAKGLKQVKDYFLNDTTVVFISISTDKEKTKWLEGLQSGLYTDGRGIDVYTMGKGFDHEITRYYFIDSYPRLMLIDKMGKLFAFNAIRPGEASRNKALIEQILSIQK